MMGPKPEIHVNCEDAGARCAINIHIWYCTKHTSVNVYALVSVIIDNVWSSSLIAEIFKIIY